MSDLAPIIRLARLAAALRAGTTLPRDDALPIADAIDRFLRDNVALDTALELKPGDGERSLATRFAIVDRDERLRAAARRHFPGRTAAAAAAELHTALARFETTAWRTCRTDDVCPPRFAGNIREDLWGILKARPYVLTARAIRQVLAVS